MKPLRTLFVSHSGGMAGAQRTLLTLLQLIDKAKFEPHLVVPNCGELADRVGELGIPVTRRHIHHWIPCVADVRPSDRWSHLYHFLVGLRARSWAVANLILKNNIDIVYTNTVTCAEGAIAALMTGKAHVWHIHEPILHNSELLPLLPSWFYVRAIRELSARVIFPSAALASSYRALSKQSSVVPNGIDFPARQNRIAARTEVATRLKLDLSKRWVAVVGAIQPRKDHNTFLAAASLLLQQRKDVHFIIIGHGVSHFTQALRDRIGALNISADVTYAGPWVGAISTALAAFDVTVISSQQESFGLTAIESMAAGTPIVSTRCGGPEEIITDGEDGLLVDVADATGMANAIFSLLQDPEKRHVFGLAGQSKAHRCFGADRYTLGIERVLLDLSKIRSCARLCDTTTPA